ncbi:uncharacterized protein JCM15063_001989 [Sporobolomyces koalae]|uniref:uncharacterized protein n=1 Tax=Sporobolomyces koalae TaxID=500713 RepID=UPI00316BDDB1
MQSTSLSEDDPVQRNADSASSSSAATTSNPAPARSSWHSIEGADTPASQDIWASLPASTSPSTSTSTSGSGYHPAYISTPPPAPASTAIDEFDPFATTAPPPAPPSTTLLGSGVRHTSKLVLIDSSDDEDDEPSDPHRRALEEHELSKQHERQQQPPASTSFGFSNMFRTLGSQSASPASSRPESPLQRATRPTSNSPPAQPSPLHKPFASLASVFRSATPPPPPETLVQAVAGKGKETEHASRDSTNEKSSPATTRPTEKHNRKRKRRPRPVASFDFPKFLEQMRSRSADPIAKYLRSFLKEFQRKPPASIQDQTKIINDFLDFIATKMRQTDPWKTIYREEVERAQLSASSEEDEDDDSRSQEKSTFERDRAELEGPERAEIEFDLTMEAMEKLVMNRLWHLTFTPAFNSDSTDSTHGHQSGVGAGAISASGDLERDQVVGQRIRLFRWIEPKHLDLPILNLETESGEEEEQVRSREVDDEQVSQRPGSETSLTGTEQETSAVVDEEGERDKQRGFINFAASELNKMNQYKAPRDKLICVLNCCKVIFGLIRHIGNQVKDQGADTFIPFLIYVVLQANPEHLVSNLQYIQRFRNPQKLAGEGGYYLSSLNAAISFIETLDASALSNITQQEFEHNVAHAVKQLAAEEPPPPPPPRTASRPTSPSTPRGTRTDEETLSASLLSPPSSSSQSTGVVGAEEPDDARKNFLLRSTDTVERAMSKPIGALAKIFESLELTANELTGQTPPTSSHQNASSSPPPILANGMNPSRRSTVPISPRQVQGPRVDPGLYADHSVSDSAISQEIERQSREAHEAKMSTLMELFAAPSTSGETEPDTVQGSEGGGIEREVVEMVLWAEQGDVGRSVERLLEMAG